MQHRIGSRREDIWRLARDRIGRMLLVGRFRPDPYTRNDVVDTPRKHNYRIVRSGAPRCPLGGTRSIAHSWSHTGMTQ